MIDEAQKQEYIKEFQRRARVVVDSVYSLRLSDPVTMEYKICCAAVDIADEQFPPDEEGEVTPQWVQIKDAFINICEKMITVKAQRKDIL